MDIVCPISLEIINPKEVLQINSKHVFDSSFFLTYIDVVNLHIDIRNASKEEWILTALTDTYNNGKLRLRNPITNGIFSQLPPVDIDALALSIVPFVFNFKSPSSNPV